MSDFSLPKSAWDYTIEEMDVMFINKKNLRLRSGVDWRIPAQIFRDKINSLKQQTIAK